MKRTFFIFLGEEALRDEAATKNSIPAGYYSSQDQWNGEQWDTYIYWEDSPSQNSIFMEARELREGEYIY